MDLRLPVGVLFLVLGALLIGSSILTFAGRNETLSSMPVVGLVGFSMAGMLGFYVVLSVFRSR